MRHRRAHRKLGRTSSHRKALLRTMVTDFLDKERIVTTVPKAKELRPFAEKMITLGKRESLHARRQALSVIRRKSVVHKLFDSLAPRFADRQGGYTRIIRLGHRKGDAAEMALIELVGSELDPEAAKKEAKPAKKPEKKDSKTEGKAAKASSGEDEKKAQAEDQPAQEQEQEDANASEETEGSAKQGKDD